MKNKFYVTTPIYYATAKPHLGSLYSTVLADIIAKWNKLKGKDVFLLTGTDEHGQKIAIEAQKAGTDPQKFVDSFENQYKHIWKLYHIDYNRFIRTTEKEHINAVQKWLLDLLQKGDIYKDKYEGWYCIPDEAYITDKNISKDDSAPICPTCGRLTTFISEESYFFALSNYQEKLLKFYRDCPDFVIPKERLNEVIKFVESGLKDLSISRTTIKWGIPFPNDDKHVTYVWADALLNYVTGIGYGSISNKNDLKFWWPADLQVMGKDILRFHAVYWPAFLMASGMELPKHLLVHGWIKVNQQKMSKSFGNVVDPELLYNKYGADPVRYYLASQIAITQDGEFSTQALERHISTDLANDLGNLVNRMITLAFNNGLYKIPQINNWSLQSQALRQEALFTIQEYDEYMNKCHFHLALSTLWKFISKVNSYFHSLEPWKLAKSEQNKFIEVISATCHSLKIIGNLLWPVMPIKSQELLDHISQDKILDGNKLDELKKDWSQDFYLKKGAPIFQKFEETSQEPKNEIEKKATNYINIEEFAKVELVVGTIEQCDEVPKSDKLYRLQVNFGAKGKRQILSGVKQYFKPEDLINKQAVFVYNLAPRKMLGLESQGMLLTVQDENQKVKAIIVEDVINGTQLK